MRSLQFLIGVSMVFGVIEFSFASESYPTGEARIKSVEYYKDVRGSIVYKTYCVLCHGVKADGNGRAAGNYTPKPVNLTVSKLSDDMKESIIRKGGAGVGRSGYMPPWGQELTDEQIRDVVYYLNVINVKNVSRRTGDVMTIAE